MKSTLLLCALALTVFASACASTPAPAPESTSSASMKTSVQEISVDALSSIIDAKESVSIYDVNGEDTRKEFGVIPGAKLLSDSSTYEMSELPSDKASKLVFYCSTQKCSAAPKAAEKASGAGYTNVNVLRAGIKGWVAANKTTDKTN